MATSSSHGILSPDLADFSPPVGTGPLLRFASEVPLQLIEAPPYPPAYTAMWTMVTDIQERVENLEGHLTYVNPRLAAQDNDFDSVSVAIADKAARFEAVLETGDEVEFHAVYASLRLDLRSLRDMKGLDKRRRFAVGYIFDALTHTSCSQIDDARMKAFRNSLAIALERRDLTPSDVDSVRSCLEGADFSFFPPEAG